jgi:hypothetical protein
VHSSLSGIAFLQCGNSEKFFTKIEAKNAAFAGEAQRKRKRRTRCWPTPHAALGISPRGAGKPRRRNLAVFHADFYISIYRDYTFFALFFKTPLRKPLISEGNAI